MIQFTEEQIEHRIKLVVKFYADSDKSLKKAALAASQIVGSYDGTSAVIAHEVGRDVSTVENWADAGKLYLELYKKTPKENRQFIRTLFSDVSASHWWLAMRIHKKGYSALYYLNKAYQHAWSGREMIKNYEADMEAGNAPMQMTRAMLSFVSLAWELTKVENQLNEKQRNALSAVRESFQ